MCERFLKILVTISSSRSFGLLKLIAKIIYSFQKDVGTPLIGDTSIIGILSEKWMNNLVIYTSFTECILEDITIMQEPNSRMPKDEVPRMRVRYEQNYKENDS